MLLCYFITQFIKIISNTNFFMCRVFNIRCAHLSCGVSPLFNFVASFYNCCWPQMQHLPRPRPPTAIWPAMLRVARSTDLTSRRDATASVATATATATSKRNFRRHFYCILFTFRCFCHAPPHAPLLPRSTSVVKRNSQTKNKQTSRQS